jgi:O-antigen ligase
METLGIGFVITQMASLISLLASMGIPWLIGYWIDHPWKITFYLGVFLVCGTLMTFSQLLGLTQNILNDAGLWGLWYTTTLFGILFTFPNLRKRWRIGLLALLGAHLYLALVRNSLWLSGWLPAMVGIAAVFFFHSRRLFVVLALGSIAFAVIGPGRPYIESVITDNIDEGGLERLDIWARSLGVVAEHWFLGTGPAGYAAYNMAYFPEDARSTHNNFFDILAQFGVLGLVIWCWFMFASLWFGWQTIRRAAPGILRTTAIIATSGWAAALFSMNLGDWILPFAYNQGIQGFSYTVYSWIFLGLLVSVHRLQKAGGRSQESEVATQEAGIYDRK